MSFSLILIYLLATDLGISDHVFWYLFVAAAALAVFADLFKLRKACVEWKRARRQLKEIDKA